MSNIKEKIARFLYGRNGADTLYQALIGLSFVLLIVSLFFNNITRYIISSIVLVIFGFAVFRFFSKNLYKRSEENRKFKNFFIINYKKIKYRKEFYYKKCKICKKVLRFKRIKGEHTATCPNCGNKLKIKIR